MTPSNTNSRIVLCAALGLCLAGMLLYRLWSPEPANSQLATNVSAEARIESSNPIRLALPAATPSPIAVESASPVSLPAAVSAGKRRGVEPQSARSDESALLLPLEQALDPLEVSGHVLFTTGRAAANVDVFASRTTLDAYGRERTDSKAKTLTDTEGHFELSLPMETASTWSLSTKNKVGRATLSGLRASDEGVLLELPVSAKIGVRMLDPVTLDTLQPTGLYWSVAGTEQWRMTGFVFVDLEGVRWFDVQAGFVDLLADSEDEELQPAVAFGVLVDEHSRHVVDLVPERGARLTVVFRSDQGEVGYPLGGAPNLISPHRWLSSHLPTLHGQRGDDAGRIRYSGLAAGTHSWAEHEVFEFDPQHFQVGLDGENHVEVIWRVVDFDALEELEAEQEYLRHQGYTD